MKFRRPPTLKTADDFISAAGMPLEGGQRAETSVVVPQQTSPAVASPVGDRTEEGTQTWPWEGKRTDKQTEVFNLRLTEVELEKLRYIAANTPDSMQAFIRKTLLPAIDAKLNEMI